MNDDSLVFLSYCGIVLLVTEYHLTLPSIDMFLNNDQHLVDTVQSSYSL